MSVYKKSSVCITAPFFIGSFEGLITDNPEVPPKMILKYDQKKDQIPFGF